MSTSTDPQTTIKNDMINATKLVKNGGLIIIDDTNDQVINSYVNKYLESTDNIYTEIGILKTYGYVHRIIRKN